MSKNKRIICQNRKAKFEYQLEDILEAGIMLTGSEVKSLRTGKSSIDEAYVSIEPDGALYLINAYIAPYEKSNRFNHDARAPRKLLLHKRQIGKYSGKIRIKGFTSVPLSMYFNEQNRVKVEIALAKGKKLHDKRESQKEKDLIRERARMTKDDW